LGDPGLLANLVYKRSPHKNGKIGVVPHYSDAHLPIVDALRDDGRFLVFDAAKDAPAKMAHQISECTLVLSSSLHGLIFADSYGVPNVHIQVSDNVTGGEFKFRDYYSSTDRPYWKAEPDRLTDASYLETLQSLYQPVRDLKRIQRDLVRTFPF
jgi:hypothetical protein